jgi:hypothetical protein
MALPGSGEKGVATMKTITVIMRIIDTINEKIASGSSRYSSSF